MWTTVYAHFPALEKRTHGKYGTANKRKIFSSTIQSANCFLCFRYSCDTCNPSRSLGCCESCAKVFMFYYLPLILFLHSFNICFLYFFLPSAFSILTKFIVMSQRTQIIWEEIFRIFLWLFLQKQTQFWWSNQHPNKLNRAWASYF